jgi:hypothetical protein
MNDSDKGLLYRALKKHAESLRSSASRCMGQLYHGIYTAEAVRADELRKELCGDEDPAPREKPAALKCQMRDGCPSPVAMVDVKGFIYCRDCGKGRKESGTRCRLLKDWELRRLRLGQTIRY